MTEIQQRGIAKELHVHPIQWDRRRLVQPDRIDCGGKRYYPARYQAVYDGLSLLILGVLFLLVAFWP
jgi:CO/xanthine dehydrogenase Mo-binding subunit